MINIKNIPEVSGIYKFTNLVNNKCYVGKSINLKRRIQGHIKDSKSNKKNKRFYSSMKKHGIENFEVEILIEGNFSKSELDQMEITYIRLFKSNERAFGYNLTKGGEGGIPNKEIREKLSKAAKNRKPISEETRQKMKNKTISEEHKEKIRQANLGRKHSEETRQKLIGRKHTEESKQKMKGKKHSEESKQIISKVHKGKPKSEETKEKLRQANLGKKASQETKQKMSLIRTGRTISKEHVEKLRQSNLTRVISDETRKKMSQSQTGKTLSKESVEKRTKTQKLNRFKKQLIELFYLEFIKIDF